LEGCAAAPDYTKYGASTDYSNSPQFAATGSSRTTKKYSDTHKESFISRILHHKFMFSLMFSAVSHKSLLLLLTNLPSTHQASSPSYSLCVINHQLGSSFDDLSISLLMSFVLKQSHKFSEYSVVQRNP
jgi:hypothetical protein